MSLRTNGNLLSAEPFERQLGDARMGDRPSGRVGDFEGVRAVADRGWSAMGLEEWGPRRSIPNPVRYHTCTCPGRQVVP